MAIQNYIFVDGPSEQELTATIQEIAILYKDENYTKGIDVYKELKSNNQYLIKFTNKPDFEGFKCFLNFLYYPNDTVLKAKALGFWTVKAQDKTPKHLIGRILLVYVSDSDTEGDNVMATYEGAKGTIKFGFAMGEEYRELDYRELAFVEPNLNKEDYQQIGTISPEPMKKKKRSTRCAPVLIIIGMINTSVIIFL